MTSQKCDTTYHQSANLHSFLLYKQLYIGQTQRQYRPRWQPSSEGSYDSHYLLQDIRLLSLQAIHELPEAFLQKHTADYQYYTLSLFPDYNVHPSIYHYLLIQEHT